MQMQMNQKKNSVPVKKMDAKEEVNALKSKLREIIIESAGKEILAEERETATTIANKLAREKGMTEPLSKWCRENGIHWSP